MAFNINKVNKIGGQALYGNAPQILTYANSAGDTVTATGFFNSLVGQVTTGDIIKVVNYVSGVPDDVVDYLVTSVISGVVAITLITDLS
jgi:hypothetical protein